MAPILGRGAEMGHMGTVSILGPDWGGTLAGGCQQGLVLILAGVGDAGRGLAPILGRGNGAWRAILILGWGS